MIKLKEFWEKIWKKEEIGVKSSNKDKGRYGEDLAVKFLKKMGMRVISRNWKSGNGEIDIVAKDEDVLVFIEVKTRQEDSLLRGALAVRHKQKKTLERTCRAYMQQMKYRPKHMRFDIVEVKLCKDGENHVNHYSNVRLFSKHFQANRHE